MSPAFEDARPRGRRPDRSSRGAGPRPGRTLLLLLALAVAAGLGARAVLSGSTGGGASEEAPERTAAAGDTADASDSVLVAVRDTLGPGEGLGTVLRQHGLSGSAFASALDAVREIQDPRRLQPGVAVRVAARVPERASRITVELDRDRSLQLTASGASGWTARLDSVPVTVDTVRVGGVVERGGLLTSDLYGQVDRLATAQYDERTELLLQLANNLFAWQIDFYRDIQPGDAFRVAIERDIRPDGTVRGARILAADFRNRDRLLTAVRFDAPDEPPRYYDAEGEATKKAFLKMPLEFGRRTSGFTRRRYHPVLKSYRAHRGIDYGAPRGTAVHATGDGTVTRAGRWGGYGRIVEIRHNGRYSTRYAHLSGIARGVRRGATVAQNEVIGYVGSTGLSTAPHLHYEFLVHGRRRDPAEVELPPGDPVPEEHRPVFRRVKEERLELLRELRLPPAGRLAAGRDGAGGPGTGGGAAE